MKLQQSLERYRIIDRLIKRENTGTPLEFAGKLGISKSQLYNCLDELRVYGADISYNKTKGSYVYLHPVEIRAEFSLRFPGANGPDGKDNTNNNPNKPSPGNSKRDGKDTPG